MTSKRILLATLLSTAIGSLYGPFLAPGRAEPQAKAIKIDPPPAPAPSTAHEATVTRQLDRELPLLHEFFRFSREQIPSMKALLRRRIQVNLQVHADYRKQQLELLGTGDHAAYRQQRPELLARRREKSAEIERQYRERAAEVLTADQMAIWDAFEGFKLQSSRFAGTTLTPLQRTGLRALCIAHAGKGASGSKALSDEVDAKILTTEQQAEMLGYPLYLALSNRLIAYGLTADQKAIVRARCNETAAREGLQPRDQTPAGRKARAQALAELQSEVEAKILNDAQRAKLAGGEPAPSKAETAE